MSKGLGDKDKERRTCFGEIDIVFPKAENGLRTTPEKCLACLHKTACLRSALDGPDGLIIQEEYIDRAYTSGHIHFLKRWSRKKDLKRKLKKRRNDQS